MANWNATAAEDSRPREGIVADINMLREQLEGIVGLLDTFDRIVHGQPRLEVLPVAKVSTVPPGGLVENLEACRGLAGNVYSRLQTINEKF